MNLGNGFPRFCTDDHVVEMGLDGFCSRGDHLCTITLYLVRPGEDFDLASFCL